MARVGKIFGSLQRGHAKNTNGGSSSGHVGQGIGQVEVMWWSNINFNLLNKVEQKGLDGTVTSTMKPAEKTFYKTSSAQEDATEVLYVEIVHPVLSMLKEQLIALLFRHGNIDVTFDEMGMFGHTCQMPDDLVSNASHKSGLVRSLSPRIVPLIINA